MNEREVIFFQLILSDSTTDTLLQLDSFDIRSSDIVAGIDHTKTYKDILHTSCGNEYHIVIKKKGDEISKLKAIEKKIEKKMQLHTRLNQLYCLAKESMENLYHKKGMDLIKEWGFMSKKPKEQQKQSKTVVLEETKKSKGSEIQTATHKSPFKMPTEHKFKAAKPVVESKSFSKTLKPDSKFLKQAIGTEIFEEVKEAHLTKKEENNEKFDPTPEKVTRKRILSSEKIRTPPTKENIRTETLRKSRVNLNSSLVNFSLGEVARTSRVKSEFNTKFSNTMKAGQMFSCLDAKMKIGGIVGGNLMNDSNEDGNRSMSALSFNSGALFNPMAQSFIGLNLRTLTEDD